MPYITSADQTSLYYEDWGSGTPIVFVNTWGLGTGMWENQVPFLVEQGFRCVTYDRRGTKRSDRPGHGYDFDTLADDLAALLDQLDLHDVVLVGHSMGGGEVTRYLARHGAQGRVAKAALLSALTPYVSWAEDNPNGFPPFAHDAVAAVIKADRAKYWAGWPGALFGTHLGNQISAETTDWLLREVMETPMMPTLATWHSIFHTDFRDDLRGFTVPTLIVHGTADQNALPELTGRRTAELVPGNTFKEYEGAAHGLFVTHKDQLNADLLDFAKS
ncbi:alpha/beta hydrolase [Kitasatospora sp. NBC_01287]|uniref:alpha/beta fold hydrolase n=1 Tax=Kitasatospora sp. NBC_01287 TaxID=2903573 RepID=UPI002250DA30|nr:alpha/beta hydrolase [Kitasatospora sp. NBC_01287]MCX4745649.1 alpha/beta hydrolase [Kitasatospora sp. NBC_01287]